MKPPGGQRCTDTGCLDPAQGRAQLTEEERRRVSARMRARMRRALSREDPHVGNRRHQNTGCRGPTIRWGIMTAELVVPTRRVASAPRVQVGRIVVIDVLRGIALFGMLVAHAHPLLPPGARGADLLRDGSAQRHRLTPLRAHDGDLGPAPALPHPSAIVGGAAGPADHPGAHPDRPRSVAGVVGDVGRRRAGVPRRAADRRGAAAVPAHDPARHRDGGGRARECAAQQLGRRRRPARRVSIMSDASAVPRSVGRRWATTTA